MWSPGTRLEDGHHRAPDVVEVSVSPLEDIGPRPEVYTRLRDWEPGPKVSQLAGVVIAAIRVIRVRLSILPRRGVAIDLAVVRERVAPRDVHVERRCDGDVVNVGGKVAGRVPAVGHVGRAVGDELGDPDALPAVGGLVHGEAEDGERGNEEEHNQHDGEDLEQPLAEGDEDKADVEEEVQCAQRAEDPQEAGRAEGRGAVAVEVPDVLDARG